MAVRAAGARTEIEGRMPRDAVGLRLQGNIDGRPLQSNPNRTDFSDASSTACTILWNDRLAALAR
jgi:hypothetical protein